jgi:hypothetical protein
MPSFFFEAAAYSSNAASAWALSLPGAVEFETKSRSMMAQAGRTGSIERFCEMVTLVIVILAFCVVGFQSNRVVSSALRALVSAEQKLTEFAPSANAAREAGRASVAQQLQIDRRLRLLSDASSKGENGSPFIALPRLKSSHFFTKGHRLQQKVVLTAIFVFFTCLARAAFIAFYGLSLSNNDLGNQCAISQCAACKGQWSNITFWILYTPALQNVVILIASPLALLVALWGMTDVGEIEQMSKIAEADAVLPRAV